MRLREFRPWVLFIITMVPVGCGGIDGRPADGGGGADGAMAAPDGMAAPDSMAAPDAADGIILSDGARTWADGSLARSCLEYRLGGTFGYTGATGDGIYRIDLGSGPIDVACDMTTDGGGWTRVVGINATTKAHCDTSAVPFAPDPAGDGKLSDQEINFLKSSSGATTPAIRFTCDGKTVYFPGSCVFDATLTGAAGDCHVFSLTYEAPNWLMAGSGDGCSANSAYATLSSVVSDGPCLPPSGPVNLGYRRVDWRGESYDHNGCFAVPGDPAGAAGAVYVK